MARKKKPEEGSSGAYWMDTYGDMITLVLTFFVLLFSFSSLDTAKWEALVANLTGTPMLAIGPINPGPSLEIELAPEPKTPEQVELEQQDQQLEMEFEELLERVQEIIREQQLESMLVAEMVDGNIVLSFMDNVLFDLGSAALRADSLLILEQVLIVIEETQDALETAQVQGHTDNLPINTAQFPNNWYLSSVRAASVLTYIQANTAIDPVKLSSVGLGEWHPVATNATSDGRARNRRVDIVLERKVIDSGYEPFPPDFDWDAYAEQQERLLSEQMWGESDW